MGKNSTEVMNEVIELLFRRCNQSDIQEICEKLEKIYLTDGKLNAEYRHEYSAISGKIEELNEEYDAESNPFDMQTLATNINLLYKYVDENNKAYKKMVFKLRDHICLEIARISYADKIYDKIMNTKNELHDEIRKSRSDLNDIDSRINKAQEMLGDLDEKSNQIDSLTKSLLPGMKDVKTELQVFQDKLDEVEGEINEKKTKIENFQNEHISILGIFASIVLTFNAGIAFSSSVLESINGASIYRIILVTLIIGIVLANVLFALFYYIDRLIHKNHEVKLLNRINIVLGGLMMATVIAWFLGVVEWRNDKINNPVSTEVINIQETVETEKLIETVVTTE